MARDTKGLKKITLNIYTEDYDYLVNVGIGGLPYSVAIRDIIHAFIKRCKAAEEKTAALHDKRTTQDKAAAIVNGYGPGTSEGTNEQGSSQLGESADGIPLRQASEKSEECDSE